MLSVKGYAALDANKPLEPFEFKRREVGPHDVLIDIKFCGICHSDIHTVKQEWGKTNFPLVPGHEIAGIVSKVGDQVTKFKVGESAGVGCYVDSCRVCSPCKNHLDNYCEPGIVQTYNSKLKDGTLTYGGYSNRIVVDENYILRIPSNLSLDVAAPLLCAGITTYSPLKHWKCGPGKKVAVIGLGGLGHMAVKIAKAMGAEVTVISHSDKKKDDALRLGASHHYATNNPETFKALANQFDIILNTASSAVDWKSFIDMLQLDGAIVALGLPEKSEITIPLGPLIFKRRSVTGSVIGSIAETQEMLDFCGKHGIGCEIEQVPIQKINEAYERVLKSDVKFRFVIDMKSLEA